VSRFVVCVNVLIPQMQSMTKSATEHHKVKPTILNTAAYIYKENGLRGLYRGVSPRICLGVWQTVCMVSFADTVREWINKVH